MEPGCDTRRIVVTEFEAYTRSAHVHKSMCVLFVIVRYATVLHGLLQEVSDYLDECRGKVA